MRAALLRVGWMPLLGIAFGAKDKSILFGHSNQKSKRLIHGVCIGKHFRHVRL